MHRVRDEKACESIENVNTKISGIAESIRMKQKEIGYATEQKEVTQNRVSFCDLLTLLAELCGSLLTVCSFFFR